MTLTIKDPAEVTSQAKAGSPSPNSESASGPPARSNPVCLEVPITIRSLPGERSNDPGAPGPVREEGRTVIVFDNGAVLRIANALPVGQTIILSNQQGRDVVCKVSAGRNLPNIKGYIEVEFIEPVNDFWHVRQSSEPVGAPPAMVSLAPPQAEAPPAPSVPAPQPREAAPEPEQSSSNAPSFEDIAGLVRMSPVAPSREKKIEPASPVSPFKGGEEIAPRQAEAVNTLTSLSEDPHAGKSTVPSVPLRTPSFSSELSARGTAASSHASSLSSFSSSSSSDGETRGRMPLILGGAALVLLGFGGAFLFMHHSSEPAPPAAPAALASQPPAQPANVATSALLSATPSVVQQAPPPSAQPVATEVAVSGVDKVPLASELAKAQRPTVVAETREANRAPARAPAAPSLKMSSPTAPKRDLSRTAEAPSVSAPDITPTAAMAGAPAPGLLSSVARTEIQPTPPPSAAPRVLAAKSATDPKLLTSTRAVYPDMAKQTKIQGTVVVALTVDAKGNVVNAKAVSGPLLLRQAALDAVKKWKYSPAVLDGNPTPSDISVSLNFRLD